MPTVTLQKLERPIKFTDETKNPVTLTHFYLDSEGKQLTLSDGVDNKIEIQSLKTESTALNMSNMFAINVNHPTLGTIIRKLIARRILTWINQEEPPSDTDEPYSLYAIQSQHLA